MSPTSKLLGSILLISGTTIGAGMLALPLSTGLAGFSAALGLFFFCWLLMLWTAFLILEINCAFPGNINLVSMAHSTLGRIGHITMWFFYLFLFYALSSAYLSGCGPFLIEIIHHATGVQLPTEMGPFGVICLLGPIIYWGIGVSDKINRLLMAGMVLAYLLLIWLLAPHANTEFLTHFDAHHLLLSFAVIFTAFGYHIIIPTLFNYFDRDIKLTKWAILIGSLIPLIVYIIWEFLILGSLPPHGPQGIASLLARNASLSQALLDISQQPLITWATRLFGILALITSFLGVTLGLFDFLRDGLKLKNRPSGKVLALILTFAPPLAFALVSQSGFFIALEYAGALVAILLGVFPVLMVYSFRYRLHLRSPYRAFGNKITLLAGLLIFCLVIVLVVSKNLGFLPVDYLPYL